MVEERGQRRPWQRYSSKLRLPGSSEEIHIYCTTASYHHVSNSSDTPTHTTRNLFAGVALSCWNSPHLSLIFSVPRFDAVGVSLPFTV